MTTAPRTPAPDPRRLFFELSAMQPVQAFRGVFPDVRDSQFDMHYALELGIVRSGKMRRQYGEYRMDCGPGDVWFSGTWEPHGFTIVSAPCETVTLVVGPEHLAQRANGQFGWMAPFTARPEARPQTAEKCRSAILDIAARLADKGASERSDSVQWRRVLLDELLLHLMEDWEAPGPSEGRASTPESHQRIQPALRMIFESKAFVPVERAARACGMSRNVFAAHFSRMTGISFAQFSLRHRLHSAALLLRQDPRAPLKAVAAQWGFADQCHLHRCFVRHYGVTPGEYRRGPQNGKALTGPTRGTEAEPTADPPATAPSTGQDDPAPAFTSG